MNPIEPCDSRAVGAVVSMNLSLQELHTIGLALWATRFPDQLGLSSRMRALAGDNLPPYLIMLDDLHVQTLCKRIAKVYGSTFAKATEQPSEVGDVTADNLVRYFWPAHLESVREDRALYKKLTIVRGSRVRLPDGTLGTVLYTYDSGERANVDRDTGGHQTYMVRELELRA